MASLQEESFSAVPLRGDQLEELRELPENSSSKMRAQPGWSQKEEEAEQESTALSRSREESLRGAIALARVDGEK
jgi:hypothetical protein